MNLGELHERSDYIGNLIRWIIHSYTLNFYRTKGIDGKFWAGIEQGLIILFEQSKISLAQC